MEGARGVLLNITGGPNMSLHEVEEAASIVQHAADAEANIIVGQVINPEIGDDLIVTLSLRRDFRAGRATGRSTGCRRGAPRRTDSQRASCPAGVDRRPCGRIRSAHHGTSIGRPSSGAWVRRGKRWSESQLSATMSGMCPPSCASKPIEDESVPEDNKVAGVDGVRVHYPSSFATHADGAEHFSAPGCPPYRSRRDVPLRTERNNRITERL